MSDADSRCDGLASPERPHYFEGKLLAVDDFRQEQTYHRQQRATHTRTVHGNGTVSGLAVRPTDPPSREIVVEAGVAVDCCGREIIVPSRQILSLDPARAGRAAVQLVVTLRFAEVARNPAAVGTGPEDGDAPQPGLIVESFELELSEPGDLNLDRYRRLLSSDVSAPSGVEALHEMLVERALRPYEPCVDRRVPLATVSVPTTGSVTAAAIDNSVRPIVLTADLVGFLLGDLLRQRANSPSWSALLRRVLRRH